MEGLIRHLVEPLVSKPEAIELRTEQGDNVLLIELVVDASDKDAIEGDKGKTLRSIRTIVSAAAGRQKASLDLVDEFTISESDDAEGDDDTADESDEA